MENEYEVIAVIGDGEVANVYTNLPANIKITANVIDFDSVYEADSIAAGIELDQIIADKNYREI